jgi:hypothetical protein
MTHLRPLHSIFARQENYRPVFLVSSSDEYTQEQPSAYLEFALWPDVGMLWVGQGQGSNTF